MPVRNRPRLRPKLAVCAIFHSLEQRRADADDRRPLLDRHLEIAAHAHRKLVELHVRRAAGSQAVAEFAQGGEVAAGSVRPAFQDRPCTSARAPPRFDSRPIPASSGSIASGAKPCLAASPEMLTSSSTGSGPAARRPEFVVHGAPRAAGYRSNGSSSPAAASGGACSAASGRSCASGSASRPTRRPSPKAVAAGSRPGRGSRPRSARRTTSSDTYLVTATSVISLAARPLRAAASAIRPRTRATFSAICTATLDVIPRPSHRGRWKEGRMTGAAGQAAPIRRDRRSEPCPTPRPPPGRARLKR